MLSRIVRPVAICLLIALVAHFVRWFTISLRFARGSESDYEAMSSLQLVFDHAVSVFAFVLLVALVDAIQLSWHLMVLSGLRLAKGIPKQDIMTGLGIVEASALPQILTFLVPPPGFGSYPLLLAVALGCLMRLILAYHAARKIVGASPKLAALHAMGCPDATLLAAVFLLGSCTEIIGVL